MEPGVSIKTGILILSLLISLFMISYYLLKAKRNPLLYSNIAFQSLICLWLVGEIYEILALTKLERWHAVAFQYFSICFMGLAWLIFSLHYIEHSYIKKRKNILPLFIIPIILYSLVLTNESHHLFYSVFEYDHRVYGAAFWIHSILSYGYVFSGTILLIIYALKRDGNVRKQSLLIILAALIPIITNWLHVFRYIRVGFDLTPVSFVLTFMLFFIASLRYKFLNIMPVALRRIFNHMDHAMVVADDCGTIINYNNKFRQEFLDPFRITSAARIESFVEKILEVIEQNKREAEEILQAICQGTKKDLVGVIELNIGERKCFKIKISPLLNKKNQVLGQVISFNDITGYKNLLDEVNKKNTRLEKLNEELTAANRQLQDYTAVAEELAVARERNRIAREAHDTLGHTMTLLINQLKACKFDLKNNPGGAQARIEEGINIATYGLKELRRSISGLRPEQLSGGSTVEAIKRLIADTLNSGVKIELKSYGTEQQCFNEKYSDLIYRTCQEAITNSMRHGHASRIEIRLSYLEKIIDLLISDNGTGCCKISKGFGLAGIQDRVNSLNGRVEFGSAGERGFRIHVAIPIGGERS